MFKLKKQFIPWITLATVVALFLILSFGAPWAYFNRILIFIGIYVILAMSLDIALGHAGLLNLGHVAFFGVGAYTSALLTKQEVPFLLALLASGILAAVCGWGLTVVTNKLKGDYLALATLGFVFVVFALMLNWQSLTRGPRGIPGIMRPSFFGLNISSDTHYLLYVVIVVALVTLIIARLVKSRYGKLLGAVRDDALGVMALGKNVFKLKYQSMMMSAFFAGIAGSLYAHFIRFIDPTSFFIADIILILTIVMVGGLASLRGSIVATVIIILLPELLRFLNLPTAVVGPLRQIIYAVVLLVILVFLPRGLFGKVDIEVQ